MSETQTSTVPALVIRRTFKAPRARVFAAWTQPELLRQWNCPPGMTLEDAHADVRVGGAYRATMVSPDGEKFTVRGIYTEVREPERLAFTHRWEEDDPAQELDTFVTVDFFERGNDTDMVFRQEGFRDEASRAGHEGGWTGTLDRLESVV